jgi:hypothetical protein
MSRASKTGATSLRYRASDPLLFLPLFLSTSSSPLLTAAPLVILEFPPLLKARGASNQLHELVPQSCWVRTTSLPSHFVAF